MNDHRAKKERLQQTPISVFVSSTWLDLRPERDAVETVFGRLRELKFIGMEYFGSRTETAREASLAEVDGCQLYIGILGARYGSGIVEAEYQRARKCGLHCLIYLQAADAQPQRQQAKADMARLAALKKTLAREHTHSEFSSPHDLAARMTADLHRWLVESVYMPAARRASSSDYPLKQLESLLADVRALVAPSQGHVHAGRVNTADVVFEILHGAPPSLAQHFRVGQFRTLIEERTRHFVGRDFVLQAIDDHLIGRSDPEFRSGYILVHGEPGIGKTTLAAQLVKLRGYVHHFNIATQNIRLASTFLYDLCAQLIVRYKLEFASLPPTMNDSGFLSRLLEEAAAKAGDLPLVVVVDALDEAEDTGFVPSANRLYLPASLPTGVYFIVTSREPKEYRLAVDRRKDIDIADMGEQNLADVRAYIHKFVEDNHERMAERTSAWQAKADERSFVNAITEKSQGNFMYLVHVLRDIRDGRLAAANIDDIYKLPRGLQEYYQRHWRTMTNQDPDRFRDYHEPVVCALASAREPVTVAQLVEWTSRRWPHLSASEIRHVIGIWREFLNEERAGDGPPLYRLYHSSFERFLAAEVGLVGYHDEIAATALRKIPDFFSEQN
jgi:Domain of unknown function (DUF4062)/AAA ATPase domain